MEQRIYGLVYEYVGAWNRHDADGLAGMYADDALYEDLRLGVTLHGTAAIRTHLRGVFAGSADAVVALGVEPLAAADRACFEWVMAGNGDGRARELRGVSVMLVEEGRIVRQTEYPHPLAPVGASGVADFGITTGVVAIDDNVAWGE